MAMIEPSRADVNAIRHNEKMTSQNATPLAGGRCRFGEASVGVPIQLDVFVESMDNLMELMVRVSSFVIVQVMGRACLYTQ